MTDSDSSPYVVKITFKRIQQFLFTVPRLKAMLGANALLGKTIRQDLCQMVAGKGFSIALSDEDGNIFSDYESYPLNKEAEKLEELEKDDPVSLLQKGILSRDGGHFTAVFKLPSDAIKFISDARAKIFDNLPGIQIDISIPFPAGAEKELLGQTQNSMGPSTDRLPYFRVCMDTGSDIASENEDGYYVSARVKDLESEGSKFKENKSKDIIGLLAREGLLPMHGKEMPKDLEQLAGKSGYLALIHADGNGMGVRRGIFAGSSEGENDKDKFNEWVSREIKNEQFFHAMRSAVRYAVVKALGTVFTEDELSKHEKLPYQLLMLGGDDLVMLTQPQYAVPFLIEYSRVLAEDEYCKIPYKQEAGSDYYPMSIGAGVIFAKKNIPFYHLNHLAEQLIDSAKKLYRLQYADKNDIPYENSVIDWQVSSQSYIDDIEQSRIRENLSDDGMICSTAKPYFTLANQANQHDHYNLEDLWNLAQAIGQRFGEDENSGTEDQDKLPRSKLKNLIQLVKGFECEKSKEYFGQIAPLPIELKEYFGEKGEELWHEMEEGGRCLTHFNDLMELVELEFLGRQVKRNTSDDNESKQGA